MISISTKELRNNLSKMITLLQKGQTFLLIHNSTPVAELKAPQHIVPFSEASDEDIQSAAVEDISEDFLEGEELEYYKSLS